MVLTSESVKRDQDADYVRHHPDAVAVSIVGGKLIYGLFCSNRIEESKGEGGRRLLGREISLTITARDMQPLKAGKSKLIIEGKTYEVYQMERQDEGSGHLATLYLR